MTMLLVYVRENNQTHKELWDTETGKKVMAPIGFGIEHATYVNGLRNLDDEGEAYRKHCKRIMKKAFYRTMKALHLEKILHS